LTDLRLLRFEFKQTILFRLRSGSDLGIRAAFEPSVAGFPGRRQVLMSSRILTSYQRKLSAFRNVSVSVEYGNPPSPATDIFLGPVISGAASIIYGLGPRLNTRPTWSLSTGYFNANVFRGKQVMISSSYTISRGENIPEQRINPGYSSILFSRNGESRMLTTNINLEKFVVWLRAKVSLNMSGSYNAQSFVLNSGKVVNRLLFFQADFGYSASFFRKINFDLHANQSIYLNILEDTPDRASSTICRSAIVVRARWKPCPIARLSMDYSFYRFTKSNNEDFLDLSGVLQLRKWLSINLSAHNIFNSKYIGFESLTPISYSSYQYRLISRYFLLSFAADF